MGAVGLADGYANPDAVVETAWVAEHLSDPGVRVVEVDEFPERYAEGHVPGAIAFNWWQDLEDPLIRDVVTGEAFARLLGAAGIGDDTTVVLYGDRNNWFATYAYWLFKYNGHGDVKVMNGGRDRWIAENRPLSTDVPSHPPRSHSVRPTREAIRAYRDDVLQKVRQRACALVDVRSPGEYSGELMAMEGYEQEGAQRRGHIAGAVNIPWGLAVRPDGTFRSAEELRALYAERGVTPDREVIAYCRIGERSSHTWFVLTELLGYPHVRNYDGSWTEWGSIVGAPIERSA
jgi:thiosulfate/3-mercaptopyruvate sulfurtransferase